MKIKLNWLDKILYTTWLNNYDDFSIPEEPGIYIFIRSHGKKTNAIYIGKGNNLKQRLRTQKNNHKLINGITNAPNGTRHLLIATLALRQGQQLDATLKLAEKMLIEHYAANGDSIINVQGNRDTFDELESERHEMKKFIPTLVLRKR
jgi:hypothetical protein